MNAGDYIRTKGGDISKITLIDNRYITSMVFKDLIEFNNQDVLFMFNTEIINNSTILRG